MRLKHGIPEPEVRNGNCCGEGCGQYDTLYKVPGIFRYRCSQETQPAPDTRDPPATG